ncbi:MAG: ABC transporter substrate-binding protein [Caulobacteraceae bacterium]|nr:ABC transporter substrate-binding protein [Caulobacteraceae bacterium]
MAAARDEVRMGVTWSDRGWCWLDSRFLYTGLQVWVREVNASGGMYVPEAGRKLPVRLIQYDDESHPEPAIRAVRRLVEEDKVDVFVSSGSSEIQKEILPLTEAARIVNLNVGAPDSALFETTRYHLQCGPSLHGHMRSRPGFWKEHGIGRVAVMHSGGPGWEAVARPLEGFAAEVGGIEFTLWEEVPKAGRWYGQYGPFPDDFDGWGRIVDKLEAAKADAVVLAFHAPAVMRIVREIRRRGLWWPYLEMIYSQALTRMGFGPPELLYQFHGGPGEKAPAGDARINVGGTQAELDAKAQHHMPGVEAHLFPRSYTGPAIWAHLVQSAGSMDADAVVAEAMKQSGKIVTLEGAMEWLPTGDMAPRASAPGGVYQIQRHPWTAELCSTPVYPARIAKAKPVFTREPYEARPPPWTGAW